MRREGFIPMLVALAVLAIWAPGTGAQQVVRATVQQLFRSNHQLEVMAGTEVVWADPHFERVWFPSGTGAPRVDRGPEGLHAVFARSGTYRGSFTVVAGHGTNDVYPLTVTVTKTPN